MTASYGGTNQLLMMPDRAAEKSPRKAKDVDELRIRWLETGTSLPQATLIFRATEQQF